MARGTVPPGIAPFGYRIQPGVGGAPSTWEIVAGEATVIRAAARAIVPGKTTISGIVRDWNAKGIRSPKGGDWTRRGVRDLMMNPHLANLRRLDEDNGNGEPELIEGTWKPILPARLYDDVLATLGDSRRGPASRRRNGAICSPASSVAACATRRWCRWATSSGAVTPASPASATTCAAKSASTSPRPTRSCAARSPSASVPPTSKPPTPRPTPKSSSTGSKTSLRTSPASTATVTST